MLTDYFKRASTSTLFKLFILFSLTLIIYYPGRTGLFVADDYPNIVDNPGIQIHNLFSFPELYSAWSANHSGILGRPIASLSFALNYYFSGEQIEPVSFKLTNIIIHAFNSLLVFGIFNTLFSIYHNKTTSQNLAFLTALIWSVHPLQLTSVLYVVQRMNSLAALFMLAGFWVWLDARKKLSSPRHLVLMYAGCFLGTSLGSLTKEVALLLPFFMLTTELTLLQKQPLNQFKRGIYLFYTVTALIPALLVLGYLISHPNLILAGYSNRDFSLSERLMTQARALFYYLGLIFYPDNTELALAHDDFPISRSLFDPITTLTSIIGLLLLSTTAIFCAIKKRFVYFSFAIGWFLVGNLMESSIISLEMVYEHRSYIPSIGLIAGFLGMLQTLFSRFNYKLLTYTLCFSVISSLAFATYIRAISWSTLNGFAALEVRNHPLSSRAQTSYAKNLDIHNGPFTEIYEHYRIASSIEGNEIGALVLQFMFLNRIIMSENLRQFEVKQTTLPQGYDAPLVVNLAYMQALNQLIHQEMLQRLEKKSNALRIAVALRYVATCLLNGEMSCISSAPYLLDWANKVIEKQPNFPELPLIYTIRAKTYFYLGDLENALDNIDLAIQKAPNEYYYYAEKADLFMTLDRLDEAEQILQKAKTLPLSGFDQSEWKSLKATLETKKAAKNMTDKK